MSIIRVLLVWVLLAVVMSGNGIFRELVLAPQLGRGNADLVSAILGVGIILGITGLFFRRLRGEPTARLAAISALLVVLTVAFEFLLGHYVDGKSWSDLAANYALWEGRLWPILLLIIALTPFIWGRWSMPRGRASLRR
jgi:hypothetical protein